MDIHGNPYSSALQRLSEPDNAVQPLGGVKHTQGVVTYTIVLYLCLYAPPVEAFATGIKIGSNDRC